MERIVKTYAELDRWSRSFVDGKLGLMFLIGPPGVGKTYTIRSLMDEKMERARKVVGRKPGGRATASRPWDTKKDGDEPPPDHKAEPLWISGGNLSAFQFYLELYEHLHQPAVVDDVDEVYRDRSIVQLLKAVTQTEEVKTVGWTTAARQLDAMNIPRKFRTKSQVCIIANRWQTLSEHVGSLQSRGVTIYFDPSSRETYDYIVREKIVKNSEVLAVAKKHLHLLRRLDIRDLLQSEKIKAADLPWEETLLDSLKVRELALLERLEEDPRMRDAWGNQSRDLMRAAFIEEAGRTAEDYATFCQLLKERRKLNAKPKGGTARAGTKRG